MATYCSEIQLLLVLGFGNVYENKGWKWAGSHTQICLTWFFSTVFYKLLNTLSMFKHQYFYIPNSGFQISLYKAIGHIMPLCLHRAEWPYLRICVLYSIMVHINSWCQMSLIIILALVLFVLYLVVFCHFMEPIYLVSISSWSL